MHEEMSQVSGLSSGLTPVMERLKNRFTPLTPEQQAENDRRMEDAERQEKASARASRVRNVSVGLGPRYSPERCRLETFSIYHASQKPVIAAVKEFVGNVAASIAEGRGVILMGTVGTGKDHLLAALLYAAAETHDCKWVNGQEVFGRFRDNIDTGKRDEDLFLSMLSPSVLAISDPIPPVGNLGQWDIGNLYRILDRRYRMLKPTWVSMNATDEDEAYKRLSEPVFDRLREGAEIFRCFWPSYRERKRA